MHRCVSEITSKHSQHRVDTAITVHACCQNSWYRVPPISFSLQFDGNALNPFDGVIICSSSGQCQIHSVKTDKTQASESPNTNVC